MVSSLKTGAKPNLYLVGFMGTGKSTVGRQLAQKLDMTYLDSDHVIEENEGLSVAQIFEQQGEARFRQLEREFVEQGHPAQGCIVSCGGGLVVQPGMMELLRGKGLVVSLFASIDTILERTGRNRNRPLLNVENPHERIKKLLAEREPIYLSAGASFTTDHRPLSDVICHLACYYKRNAPCFIASGAPCVDGDDSCECTA